MVRGIHQVAEWNFKNVRHLGRIGLQLKAGPYKCHHRRNDERRSCDISWQGSQHFDEITLQANLFLCFTQGSIHRVLVGLVGTSSRKGDLARMG